MTVSGKDKILLTTKSKYFLVTMVSVFATIIAILGQNTFIGVYVDDFLQQIQVSYFKFSLILMTATIISSLLVKKGSQALDELGFSKTIFLVSLAGATSLVTLAYLPEIISRTSLFLASLLFTFALVGMRLCFRGLFRVIAASIVISTVDQDARRRVFTVVGILSGILGSLLPLSAHKLNENLGVSTALLSMALTVAFFGIATSFLLRNAKNCTTISASKEEDDGKQLDETPSTPLALAKKDFRFWLYMIGIALNPLILSSATLFLVAIASYHQVEYSQGLLFFFPASAIGIPAFVLGSLYIRYVKTIFLSYQLALLLAFTGFLHFDTFFGKVIAAIGFGSSAALYTACTMNMWATLYGRKFINEFLGFSASIDLLFSAIGPVLFGLLIDIYSVKHALLFSLSLPIAVMGLYLVNLTKSILKTGNKRRSGQRPLIVAFNRSLRTRFALMIHLLQMRQQLQIPLFELFRLCFSIIPCWQRSFSKFPNHVFNETLWQQLEQGSHAPIALFYRSAGKWNFTYYDEQQQKTDDIFLVSASIYQDLSEIFQEQHPDQELLKLDGLYYTKPKAYYRREI